MLVVKNLSKKYPGESLGAVNDISFQANEGEILSFVGHSGSGKTTLLRMLAGLMGPDSGEIIYKGEPLDDPEEQLIAGHDKIKLVHQDYKLKPNMTVRENVKYQLLHFDKAFQQERTDELLALCKLEELSDKKPHELSGGQQQRLAIARALSEEPEILLLDEPFSSLDPMTKEDLLFDLLDIARLEKSGIILVTHDTSDALKVSERIGFIKAGKLIQLTAPFDIYNSPANLEIAEFFGRVNRLKTVKGIGFIRAEHIFINEQCDVTFKVHVLTSSFLGSGFINQAETQSGEAIWFKSSTRLGEGEEVQVGYNTSDLLRVN